MPVRAKAGRPPEICSAAAGLLKPEWWCILCELRERLAINGDFVCFLRIRRNSRKLLHPADIYMTSGAVAAPARKRPFAVMIQPDGLTHIDAADEHTRIIDRHHCQYRASIGMKIPISILTI